MFVPAAVGVMRPFFLSILLVAPLASFGVGATDSACQPTSTSSIAVQHPDGYTEYFTEQLRNRMLYVDHYEETNGIPGLQTGADQTCYRGADSFTWEQCLNGCAVPIF